MFTVGVRQRERLGVEILVALKKCVGGVLQIMKENIPFLDPVVVVCKYIIDLLSAEV